VSVAFCVLAVLLTSPVARAQSTEERSKAIQERLRHFRLLGEQLSPNRLRALSGAAQNLVQLSRSPEDLRPKGRVPRAAGATLLPGREAPVPGHGGGAGLVGVSDPSTDLVASQVSGFTQSETSTAWCGDTVVVGFNDSGSYWETFFGTGGLSFNGVARSTDKGRTFTDLGFLNPGDGNPPVEFFNFLAGDPVVACSSETDFRYASLFQLGAFPNIMSAISVSTSTDGGQTFDEPVAAAAKPYLTVIGGVAYLVHFLDKPWFAIDPADPDNMYVTYTDFDASGTSAGCGATDRTAIEVVRTTDGGTTWSAPLVIEEVCGPSPFVQGSNVAVGPDGEVYVVWERATNFITRDLRVRKSTDGGATFGAAQTISPITCVGDCYALVGGFRSGFEFPMLAVDRSTKATRGNVYVAWHDGRRVRVPDVESPNGFYGYADILLSRSTDGGATWSAPAQVNRLDGQTDQFQPGLAVDGSGDVGVCYYDRASDPGDFYVSRSCSVSRKGGGWWHSRRLTERSWPPFHATDAVINPYYMGDYDALTSNVEPGWWNRGFVGAFSREDRYGNPDVFANRVR
jgi:hypothetical protein